MKYGDEPGIEQALSSEPEVPFEVVEAGTQTDSAGNFVVLLLDIALGVGLTPAMSASPDTQRISSPMASAVSIRIHAEGFGVPGPWVTSQIAPAFAHDGARRVTSWSRLSSSVVGKSVGARA